MSRRRIHAGEFVKLLESAAAPLYVVDDSFRVVYLNEACRTWLGEAADELLGQTCVYHSGSETGVAAGLCPPPQVLEGQEMAAVVSYNSSERTSYRRARFVPLRWGGSATACILALVEPRDLAEPPGETEPGGAGRDGAEQHDDARELHRRLQLLRQQKAVLARSAATVGASPAARRAAAQAELAAACGASVLLVGPPGSGRRRLAEAIHYRSPRESNRPLVPLECGLLDAELVRSALRLVASAGRDEGTLLLCDVDQSPAEGQAALAAALSSPRFRWRTIATAAAPLAGIVAQGRFRADLAAALSTLVIELPPLAARRDDLPLMAQALLEEQNARRGKQIGGFAPEALDRLYAYPWPGNLGELAQFVAESHVRSAGALVRADDLPERLGVAAEAALRPRRKEEPIRLDEFVARVERELIERALARSKGNKARAARLLGLNRPRLYRRMVQLGLIEKEDGNPGG